MCVGVSRKAGLNLMPFEFITAHHDDAAHVTIVSEFSGCCRVLLGSLRINPWNSAELEKACLLALNMSERERRQRSEAGVREGRCSTLRFACVSHQRVVLDACGEMFVVSISDLVYQ